MELSTTRSNFGIGIIKDQVVYAIGGIESGDYVNTIDKMDLIKCYCVNNYYGNSCILTTCNGTFSNLTEACTINGDCIDYNTCHCRHAYSGNYCLQSPCFGISRLDEGVCHGHGSCLNLNHCECTHDYVGDQCQCMVGQKVSGSLCHDSLFYFLSSYITMYNDEILLVRASYIHPIVDNSTYLKWITYRMEDSSLIELSPHLYNSTVSSTPMIQFPQLFFNIDFTYRVILQMRSTKSNSLLKQSFFDVKPIVKKIFGGSMDVKSLFPSCPFYNFTFTTLEDSNFYKYSLEFSTIYSSQFYCPLRNPSFIQFLPSTFAPIFVKGSIYIGENSLPSSQSTIKVDSIPDNSCDINESFMREAKDAFFNLQNMSIPCSFQSFILSSLNNSVSLNTLYSNFTFYIDSILQQNDSCLGLQAYTNMIHYFSKNTLSYELLSFHFLIFSNLTLHLAQCDLSMCTFYNMLDMFFYFTSSLLSHPFDETLIVAQPNYWFKILSSIVYIPSPLPNETCSFHHSYLSLNSFSTLHHTYHSLYIRVKDMPFSQSFYNWLSWNDSISIDSDIIILPPSSNSLLNFSLIKSTTKRASFSSFKCVLWDFSHFIDRDCTFDGSYCRCNMSSIPFPSLLMLFNDNLISTPISSDYSWMYFFLLLIPCFCCVMVLLLFCFCIGCCVFFTILKRKNKIIIDESEDPMLVPPNRHESYVLENNHRVLHHEIPSRSKQIDSLYFDEF